MSQVARLRGGVKRAAVTTDDDDDAADEEDEADEGTGVLSALTGVFSNVRIATYARVIAHSNGRWALGVLCVRMVVSFCSA